MSNIEPVRAALLKLLKEWDHSSESIEWRGYTGDVAPDGKSVSFSYRSTHLPTDICPGYKAMAEVEVRALRVLVLQALLMVPSVGSVQYDLGLNNCKGWIKVTVHL